MLRFGVVGIVGFVVNAGLVEGLAGLINPIWAQVVAFPAAATTTWWLNRHYTFGCSQNLWHVEWLRYVGANVSGWIANNGVYFALILNIPLMYSHASLAVAAGSLAGMVLNFVASKWFVFK
jgi:putative flippase GtrA